MTLDLNGPAVVSVKLSHWKSGLEVLSGSLDCASVLPKLGSMLVCFRGRF